MKLKNLFQHLRRWPRFDPFHRDVMWWPSKEFDRHHHHPSHWFEHASSRKKPPLWPEDGHFHRPPPWWPENEPFPPRRHSSRLLYNRFFQRLGCALFGLIISVILVVILVFGWTINRYGLIQPPINKVWLIVIGVVALVVFPWNLVWGRRSFRYFSVPILELFQASARVAEGDYDVHIKEHGTVEVRALVRAFNSMAARLKKADEQRRSLLADVTHELRTPLTVIRGNLEGILDGVYEADETRLKSILDEANILSRLVDDLRTLALAESGALQLNREATDLAALVHDVVSVFQTQAAELGIDLLSETAPDLTLVYLDGERIHQVLSNLVINALRYTPTGGYIRLRCEMAPMTDGDKSAAISVEDSGPGIKAEDLPYVFERFYKTSDSGGMGLGLAIVKNIVEAHGGSVDVESKEGKGTKFIIRIPIPAA